MKSKKSHPEESRGDMIEQYFLACEFKPNSDLWSVFDPFAYDIQPAYINGSLGVIAYDPDESYSIIEINKDSPSLFGYVFTITHPETAELLNKCKGYYGEDAFNMHTRVLVDVNINQHTKTKAWCYMLTPAVMDKYRQIEQVEYGIWDGDEKLLSFLEKVESTSDPE